MRERRYGRNLMKPSALGIPGTAIPGRRPRFPVYQFESCRSVHVPADSPVASTAELMKILSNKPDWRDAIEAANALGERVARLEDLEALGYVARFCEDDGHRETAMGKLALRITEVRDIHAIEALVMNTNDDAARRKAIEVLGRRSEEVAGTSVLIHIAMCAKQRSARHAAVMKLREQEDALNVISLHSEYEDTRETAKRLLARFRPDAL
jgi:hypothetical protein